MWATEARAVRGMPEVYPTALGARNIRHVPFPLSPFPVCTNRCVPFALFRESIACINSYVPFACALIVMSPLPVNLLHLYPAYLPSQTLEFRRRVRGFRATAEKIPNDLVDLSGIPRWRRIGGHKCPRCPCCLLVFPLKI